MANMKAIFLSYGSMPRIKLFFESLSNANYDFEMLVCDNYSENSPEIREYIKGLHSDGMIKNYMFFDNNIMFNSYRMAVEKFCKDEDVLVALLENDRHFAKNSYGNYIDHIEEILLDQKDLYSVSLSPLYYDNYFGKEHFISSGPRGSHIVKKDLYLKFCYDYRMPYFDTVGTRYWIQEGYRNMVFCCTNNNTSLYDHKQHHWNGTPYDQWQESTYEYV